VITNPRPLTTGEALLLCAAAAVLVVLVLFARRRQLSASTCIAAALIAGVAATAPFTGWSIASDAWSARDYSAFAAARIGPEDNGIDTKVVDRVALLIPRRATYAIVIAPRANQARGGVFRVWTLAALLPRVAVEDLSKADWVVTFGAPPERLGLPVRDVHPVRSQRSGRMTAWVGRLR
jgi:hypothetical protein